MNELVLCKFAESSPAPSGDVVAMADRVLRAVRFERPDADIRYNEQDGDNGGIVFTFKMLDGRMVKGNVLPNGEMDVSFFSRSRTVGRACSEEKMIAFMAREM